MSRFDVSIKHGLAAALVGCAFKLSQKLLGFGEIRLETKNLRKLHNGFVDAAEFR
ncbi:MAG TPA: hypothetical protein VH302_06895 [Bryobacteraceae bacterium]|jgi:hypothetical protein|nr:hypothetical protein [Bryobacteraceae bacterium]